MKKKILSAWLMLIATFFVSFAAYADTQTIAPNGYSGNNIYLPDQRVQVNNATSFPYNTIVDIQDIFPNNPGEVWRGTGTLIAPGVVLTAGHVIYDKSEGGYANSVTVYQAYANGNYNPSTAVTAKALLAHPDWVAKNNSSPSIYVLGSTDLALIFLNQNIGLQTGWMGMSSSLSVGQPITLAGFPGDYRDQMWKMSGSASSISNSLISYSNISTYPGQSGSPLISTSNTIVGVNVAQAVYGENSSKVPSDQATTYPNWGIQLTTANIAWIQNNVPELKTTALYRLYNPGNSDHLYTKNLAEMRSLAT
ncbi:MAG: trypsin-like peptidase domain-containing protein, partial [Streptococcaceae bacterium]|nr:trypsin-like peptidase domain-containing protein [Streptococcaceae bacterium]